MPPAADEFDEPDGGASFPVVGVGASAGGLEAFTQRLKALPADTGMAFVLVQLLRHGTGVDFTGYKFNTLYRRVTRRVVFRKLDSLAEYLR